MSPRAVVWIVTAAGLIVLLALAVRAVARAVREAKRAALRVRGYVDAELVAALRRGQADAARLQASLSALEALTARAEAAVAIIRRGPIPPDVRAGASRIGAELEALVSLGRRA